MRPAPFELHDPATLTDATGLLAELGEDSKVLAGGQSLVPLLALRLTRFGHLVDINRIPELAGVRAEDGWLAVGAVTRQAVAERHPAVVAVPLLGRALAHVGHFQIRNRGTVGGSIAHADPASELPAVALALDAELVVTSRAGERRIAASDFFEGTWTTAMRSDELLASVRFPIWSGRCGFAVEEFARRHGDFAIAGAACGVQVDDSGVVQRAGIALFGMGPTPLRAGAAEAALAGQDAATAEPRTIGRIAVVDTEPPDDLHGSAAFRRRVGAWLVEQALSRAIAEATGKEPA